MNRAVNNFVLLPLLASACFGTKAATLRAAELGRQDPQPSDPVTEVFTLKQDELPPIPDISFPSITDQKQAITDALPTLDALNSSSDSNAASLLIETKQNQARPAGTTPNSESPTVQESAAIDTGNIWEGLARQIPAPAVWLAAYGVAILSVLAALRGVIKGYIEVRAWKSKQNRIKKWNLTDSFQLEYLSVQRNGQQKLRAVTRTALKLTDVLVTGGAADLFIKAATQCDPNKPFPLLNLPRETVGHFLFKRETDRLQYLRRIQQDIIRRVQGVYHDSPYGRAEGMQLYSSKESKIEVRPIVVLPVCEVTKVGRTVSRKLILYTISQDDLNIIRNAANLIVEQGTDPTILNTVQLALTNMDKFYAQEIFPIANIFIKRGKELIGNHTNGSSNGNGASGIDSPSTNQSLVH